MTQLTTRVRYEKSYLALMEACRSLVAGRREEAKARIEGMVLSHVDAVTCNEALLAHTASSALMRRIDRRLMASKNIYLQEFDVPQIVLFYKMLEAYPQVAASHRIANQFVLSRLAGHRHASFLDVGIGKGKQLEGLLRAAAADGTALASVDVVGLDLDIQNVCDSEALFASLAKELPFTIRFHPMCRLLEELSEEDLRQVRDLEGPLFINSAFTMHHAAHPVGDRDRRTRYFETLRSLGPVLFTLVEPHSDHDEERLTRRLHNCWTHFSTVFELIDRSSIADEHRFLVKQKFFGREIENILGVSDHLRSERHEPLDVWLLRFARTGFVPVSSDGVSVELPDYCDSSIADGVVSLGYDTVPLVGVMAFEPGPGETQGL
jgi:hypothetical protein